jgi:ABC-type branched-subunit amino acid transport system substrate-binding protein
MSAEFNIVINQNADFTRKFKLKTPGTTDITNYTITSATQTAALKAGVYQYDILSADGSGIKTTLVSGTATVEAGITP